MDKFSFSSMLGIGVLTNMVSDSDETQHSGQILPPNFCEPVSEQLMHRQSQTSTRELPPEFGIVSNRVSLPQDGPAAGGLAVAVDALKETNRFFWFGWNGKKEVAPSSCFSWFKWNRKKGVTLSKIEKQAQQGITYLTVGLTEKDYNQYYCQSSNGMLWPAFHDRLDLSKYDARAYKGYKRVNKQFAQYLKPFLQHNIPLWVHDYHVIPFAKACRDKHINNPIGFFLHIPFPEPETLRTIPQHPELIKALCCYDVIGFQTRKDLQSFLNAIKDGEHGTAEPNEVEKSAIVHVNGRYLKAKVYPIGIYPDKIAETAKQNSNCEAVTRLLKHVPEGEQLILSFDRLDYTKGLCEKIRGVGQMLVRDPAQAGKFILTQIAPESRPDVKGYPAAKEALDAEVERVNGQRTGWKPIHYEHEKYKHDEVVAMLRAAHVCCVTSLRDGMNLVAKEFVAAQDPANSGVLVLSKFAGAADDLPGAILVDPTSPEQVADALSRALSMPIGERLVRYAKNMVALGEKDLSWWSESFLRDLRSVV